MWLSKKFFNFVKPKCFFLGFYELLFLKEALNKAHFSMT